MGAIRTLSDMTDPRLDITSLIMDDHEWLRRQFARLDDAHTPAELAAVWEPLALRLDTHAQAEETVFYPALLKRGDEDEAEEETDDAIRDHNKIRDAVEDARKLEVGTDEWFEAVGRARSENSEHLAEEEDEGLPDFRKHASAELRAGLGELWLRFYAQHADGRDVRTSDLDPEQYIAENS
jgi:Hemerythrin HHE cation binding domain